MKPTSKPKFRPKPKSKPNSKPWIKWHDITTWIYIYPVRALFCLIPVNILQWLVRTMAPAYARLRRGQLKHISKHMEKAFVGFEAPAASDAMAGSVLAGDLCKITDDLLMHRLDQKTLNQCVAVSGSEHLDSALAEGKGVIVISGHFHANRLAKYYLRRNGYPFISIFNRDPLKTTMGRFGNRFVAPAYERFLKRIIEDEIQVQDADMGVKILKSLRLNRIINIHLDAGVSTQQYRLSFLNEHRLFAGGYLRLAELTGAPLVPMQCLGDSRRCEVIFGEPIRYTGKSSAEEFVNRLKEMADLLESWVRTNPGGWVMWRRFR